MQGGKEKEEIFHGGFYFSGMSSAPPEPKLGKFYSDLHPSCSSSRFIISSDTLPTNYSDRLPKSAGSVRDLRCSKFLLVIAP
jgi:hypothetical protein